MKILIYNKCFTNVDSWGNQPFAVKGLLPD